MSYLGHRGVSSAVDRKSDDSGVMTAQKAEKGNKGRQWKVWKEEEAKMVCHWIKKAQAESRGILGQCTEMLSCCSNIPSLSRVSCSAVVVEPHATIISGQMR